MMRQQMKAIYSYPHIQPVATKVNQLYWKISELDGTHTGEVVLY